MPRLDSVESPEGLGPNVVEGGEEDVGGGIVEGVGLEVEVEMLRAAAAAGERGRGRRRGFPCC